MKNPLVKVKVVEKAKKGIQIDFESLLFSPKSIEDLTTFKQLRQIEGISELQKKALEKIEKYWLERIRNYNNWKTSKHWSYNTERISSRIDKNLYDQVKSLNPNKIIQNFIRYFLRDISFREIFHKKLREQLEKDLNHGMGKAMMIHEEADLTTFKQELIRIYPHVVSGNIFVREKELFIFYCYFFIGLSPSYILRCALIHFREIDPQEPILDFGEPITILKKILEG